MILNFDLDKEKKRIDVFVKIIAFFLLLSNTNRLCAQFLGDYDQENWTFISENPAGIQGNGFVDTIDMPNGFKIVHESISTPLTTSDFMITIPADGILKFKWSYSSNSGPHNDRAGFKINNNFYELTDPNGDSYQYGEWYVKVEAHQIFRFSLISTDYSDGADFTIGAFLAEEGNNFPANSPPTLDPLHDLFTWVSPGEFTVFLNGISAGIIDFDQNVSITATTDNEELIPEIIVGYNSPDPFGTLNFTFSEGVYGDAIITVSVVDDGGVSPGGMENEINEVFQISVTGNFPPTIGSISDVNGEINELINVDLLGISFGSLDAVSQNISVSAHSSNQEIVADEDIIVSYINPNNFGSLSITPKSDAIGSTEITVIVKDDGGTANNGKDETVISFSVTFQPNKQPLMDELDDLYLLINPETQVIQLNGIGDGEQHSNQTLTISATSSNTDLVPHPEVNYLPSDDFGSLVLDVASESEGVATISVLVIDDGGKADGGIEHLLRTFQVTVSGNYPPEIGELNDIVMGINETRDIILQGINAGKNPGEEILSIYASSSNTEVIAIEDIAIDVLTQTGETDARLLQLTPVVDAIGETVITVTVMDGASDDESNTVEESFIVRVIPNQAPSMVSIDPVQIEINAPEQFLQLYGISSGENRAYQEISLVAISDNPSLIPDPAVSYVSPSEFGSLTFTPEEGEIGLANITIAVMDNGGTDYNGINVYSEVFEVNVVSDIPPTISEICEVFNTGNAFTTNIYGISDGTGFEQSISVTASSDNPLIVPDPVVHYVDGESMATLDFTPVNSGRATITVRVTDDGNNVTEETFDVHINSNAKPEIQFFGSGVRIEDNVEFYFNKGTQPNPVFFRVTDRDHKIQEVSVEVDDFEFNALYLKYLPYAPVGLFWVSAGESVEGTFEYTVRVKDNGDAIFNNEGIEEVDVKVNVMNPFRYSGITGVTERVEVFQSSYYHIQPFTIDKDGIVYIERIESQEQAFFYLYEDYFGGKLLTNRFGVPEVVLSLEKGKQYVLATRAFSSGVSFENAIGVKDGKVNFGTIPYLDFLEDIDIDEEESFVVPLSGISDGSGDVNNLTLRASTDTSEILSLETSNNENGTGSLTISPHKDFVGEYTASVEVVSESGTVFNRSFEINVNPINDAPAFTLFQDELNITSSDLDKTFVFNVVPENVPDDEKSQEVRYSISPQTVDFLTVSIDENTGRFVFSDFKNETNERVFTITADDQQLENNLASQNMTVVMNGVLEVETLFSNSEIYPNPSRDVFYQDLKGASPHLIRVLVDDLAGNRVLEFNPSYNGSRLELDLSPLKHGIYVITLKNNESSYTQRVIKMN